MLKYQSVDEILFFCIYLLVWSCTYSSRTDTHTHTHICLTIFLFLLIPLKAIFKTKKYNTILRMHKH